MENLQHSSITFIKAESTTSIEFILFSANYVLQFLADTVYVDKDKPTRVFLTMYDHVVFAATASSSAASAPSHSSIQFTYFTTLSCALFTQNTLKKYSLLPVALLLCLLCCYPCYCTASCRSPGPVFVDQRFDCVATCGRRTHVCRHTNNVEKGTQPEGQNIHGREKRQID
jgi:hypothetical protein